MIKKDNPIEQQMDGVLRRMLNTPPQPKRAKKKTKRTKHG
jgi:hypothetical protein